MSLKIVRYNHYVEFTVFISSFRCWEEVYAHRQHSSFEVTIWIVEPEPGLNLTESKMYQKKTITVARIFNERTYNPCYKILEIEHFSQPYDMRKLACSTNMGNTFALVANGFYKIIWSFTTFSQRYKIFGTDG